MRVILGFVRKLWHGRGGWIKAKLSGGGIYSAQKPDVDFIFCHWLGIFGDYGPSIEGMNVTFDRRKCTIPFILRNLEGIISCQGGKIP